ncbi:MAG TPA: MBL fold metallo-hydrolase [Caulobacteraceae bacterium]|jgi:glyoxylase-like metal-dependent hydrolase (beta-lactamase superfamily II)
MTPQVRTFFDPATSTATHLVFDPAKGVGAIIDPVLDFDPKSGRVASRSADQVLEGAAALGLTISWILETHPHADHMTAAGYLKKKTGAKTAIGARILDIQKHFKPMFEAEDVSADGREFDRLLADGDRLPLGELTIEVMATPGHTPVCVTYRVGNAAFMGDTLFMPDYGSARCDFVGGDAAALYRSIQKLFALPDDTRLFTAHDYKPAGRDEAAWESTVAEQRAHNIHAHIGVSEEAFVAMRKGRDAYLEPPVLMLPSLQVNIRGGALPPATELGHVFLKIPVRSSLEG